MSKERAALETVRAARRELATAGPSRTRSEDDFERVSLPHDDCDALRDLLIAEQAAVVIEVGLAYGSSALAIGEALISQNQQGARHVILDAYQGHFHDSGWHAVTTAGLNETSTLLRERSQVALPRLLAEGLVADAAFVDGSHSFHNVFVDLYFLRELVRPGGLIVLDDCHWPSVSAAVRYFEINAGWTPEVTTQATRLRTFRLPDPPVEPKFEDFKPFSGADRGNQPSAAGPMG